MMVLTPGNAQWIGQRAEQQDAFGFAGFDQPDFREHAGVLAVLADGMGGMHQGREASQLAVRTMLDAYREKRPDERIGDALVRSLTSANDAVHALACRGAGEGDVGTTLVAVAVHQGQALWIGAGDSRLYLYRAADGSLTQCTQDHNYGNELLLQVAAGVLSREVAARHPDREALTSFLGLAEVPKIDANLRPLSLAPGDRLLLCSDGLHGVLTDEEIKARLGLDAQAAADALIAAVQAKRLERQDNATLALIAARDDVAPAAPVDQRPPRRARVSILAALGLLLGLAVVLGLIFWSDPILRSLGIGVFEFVPRPAGTVRG